MADHGQYRLLVIAKVRLARRLEHEHRALLRARRIGRAGRVGLRLEQLETRTMLSAATVIGPRLSPSAPAEETMDLQLQPGSLAALASLQTLISGNGATIEATTISGLYQLQVPTANMNQLAALLAADPAVQYAQPAQTVTDLAEPNDPGFTSGDEWQLNGTWGINVPGAWDVTTGSDLVIVADTDTGIAYNDPDLYDNVWINQAEIPSTVLPNLTDVYNDGVITFADLNNPINQGAGKIIDTNGDGIITATDVLASTTAGGWVNPDSPNTQDNLENGDPSPDPYPDDLIGWNFSANNNNPLDGDGHGTFTAGEIAEVGNNGVGGAGVNWNVQLMPVQFLDSSGNGTDTGAAEAIDYAVDHGAKVINASWGASGTDSTIAAAIEYADQHGVIIVAAAGNNGTDDDNSGTFFSPASYSTNYPNLISVAATDSNGDLASFSNYGVASVQLAAPGVNVYGVESNGTYGVDSGTSMAAPLVTGTIALVEAAHPSWSMSQVIDAVLDTTTPDPNLVGKVTTGGIVNAAAAVANTDGPYVVSASPDGSVNSSSGLSSVQLNFNEEINPATFTASQVTLTGPCGAISGVTVTPVTGSNDHEFTISFPTQAAAGSFTLKVGPDIQDWYGNDMNQNRNGVNGEADDAFVETIRQTAPGATDLFSISGIPSGGTAGTSETFTVTALSATGGTDTSFLGTIEYSSTDPQAVLPASYTFTSADQGAHSFTVTFKTAGTQAITATDAANAAIVGTEENIVVQAAAASSLKLAGFPTTETAGTPETLTLTAYDAYGNVAPSYAGTVNFTSSDAQASLPASATFTPEDQGTLSFTATLKTAGTQSITATDTGNSGIAGSESGIIVEAAAASSLVLTGLPTTETAGAGESFTVSAIDPYGNLAAAYVGMVTFSSTDPQAILPGSYTFTTRDDGKHTFAATLKTVGPQSITLTDSSGLTGIESGIVVKAAAATTLSVTGFPTNDTAGTAASVTVTAHDAYGNVATGYTGTVSLTSSDPHAVLPSSYVFTAGDAGKHSFSVTLDTSGTQSIAATDTATSSIMGIESGIAVQAAAAKTLTVTGFPSSDTAGISGTVTVTAYDAYGNVATGYTGTVALTSSDPHAVLPSNCTFTAGDAGKHSFAITLETSGTQSITATDTASSTITGTEPGVAVQAAVAKTLAVTGFPTSDTAGVSGTVTVTAYDAYGNVATGYTGTVSLTSSDPRAVLPSNYTFTAGDAGKHSFSVTLDTSGTQSIAAADTGTSSIAGSESGIAVRAAAARALAITGFPATDTAGTAGSVTVTAYDAYGNVATGYTGTVGLTSSDPLAVLPSNYTFTSTDAGKHSFSITLDTSGPQSITASDTVTSSLSATESAIAVQAAAAKTLSVTGFPTSDTAGTTVDMTITAYDAYGNVATGYTGTVDLMSTDPLAVLPSSATFDAADAGKLSFAVTLDTAGTQSITATDSVTPSIRGTESGIAVQAAPAKTLAFTGFPTSDTAGTAGTVTITAYDPYGNVATGYTGTLDLTSSDPQAVLPVSYTFSESDAGKHSFPITLDTSGTQSITATDSVTSSLSATESGIAVQAAAAKTLTVTGFPTSEAAGTSSTVAVTAYDAYGNVATGYRGIVALSSSDPSAVLPSSYTFTAADAGLHGFAVELHTAGAQSITATDSANPGLTGTETGITVRAVPQVTWNAPASIVYGTPLGAGELDATANVPGTFSYSPAAGSFLDAGGDPTLTVTFTPQNSTYYTTAATSTTITVTRATPVLEVIAGGAPSSTSGSSIYGETVNLTATVGTSDGTPRGTVTFYDGNTPLASVPVEGTGTAIFTTSKLSVGSHSITAAYSGDADFQGVRSAAYSVIIAPTATQVVLVQTPVYKKKSKPASVSQTPIRLTVEITRQAPGANVPTGEVTFELLKKSKKKTRVITLAKAALSGGEATLSLQASKVMKKSITIVYGGDANDRASSLTTPKLK